MVKLLLLTDVVLCLLGAGEWNSLSGFCVSHSLRVIHLGLSNYKFEWKVIGSGGLSALLITANRTNGSYVKIYICFSKVNM